MTIDRSFSTNRKSTKLDLNLLLVVFARSCKGGHNRANAYIRVSS